MLMVGWIILAAFATFIAVIIVRTLRFRPADVEYTERVKIEFDGDRAIGNLAELIRCRTVSYYDKTLEDDAEFEKLKNSLPVLYPNVHAKCSFTQLPDRALLYKWQGRKHDAPAVMMAHYDVVPVNEENWEKPAFEGIIENGVLWGRGSLDTKVTFNGVLFAADTLIENGFVPENDIYFAFSGGEEVNGNGTPNIVDWFIENGIEPAMVVDEGGAVVEGVFPGVKQPCGLIGIAEKGMMNVTFSVKSAGGHASAPKPHTPVGVLAKACCAVENNPFPMHLTKPVAEMFDTLGRYSTFIYRMIFANMWLFSGILNIICKKSGGEMNALMRTTVAFTQMNGSSAPNVIPPDASMVANIRLNPEDSVDSARERLIKTVNDPSAEVTIGSSMEPSRISRTGCDAWDRVAAAVANTWPGSIVSPYLMVQCSDSRHYGRISDRVYRFSAMDLTSDERKMIHGNNERVRLDCAKRAVEFYIRLMKSC